jgi:alkylation response protein AidB-like acyl-CoA dehydrogenase
VLSFTPPLRDLGFALDVIGLEDLLELPAFAHVDRATVGSLLEQFGRLMADQWGDLPQPADRFGVRVDHDRNTTVIAPGFAEAYGALVAGGWMAVSAPAEHGGGGFPQTVGLAMTEMMGSACIALQLCPMLSQAAIEAIATQGTPAQQERYLGKLISGEWSGTMQLSEPDAGSDVGALRTRAVQAPDGTWRITGQKIYITWGEHELTENIVHVVLARRDGAPAGTKGISCFIVPRRIVDADGSPGDRNDVRVVSVEHKMGIHASPTCVLAYGDSGDGAVAELIGEVDAGMKTMFVMMNNARLSVGQQGVAIAERAYQLAVSHALGRVQGRTLTGADTIVGHPDVARMLMLMRSQLDAARMLVYLNARAIDEAHHAAGDAKAVAQERADLLTPLSKGWCTDLGVELTSLGVQIHGGMGFCEDTGAAQLYREARVLPIYEGTNGIQALDLVNRKLPMRGGAVVREVLSEIDAVAGELIALAPTDADLAMLGTRLRSAASAAADASGWLLDALRRAVADAHTGATPYLRLLATVVGGALMARQALHAMHLAATAGDDDGYLAAKRASAVFFGAQVLPAVHSLAAQVTAGSSSTLAIAPELLAPR